MEHRGGPGQTRSARLGCRTRLPGSDPRRGRRTIRSERFGVPRLGAILNDVSAGSISCDDPRTLAGYAAHGRSIKAAIEPLVSALAVQLFDDGSQIRTPNSQGAAVDGDELGASADQRAPRHERNQVPAEQLPTTVRILYYDPARDYQFGEARASVSDAHRGEEQRDLPAVVDAGDAKALAQQLLARSWAERDRLTVRLPPRHLALEPGAILELPFSPGRWTIERSTFEGFACVLELRASPASAPSPLLLSADAGRLLPTESEIGAMEIALFEAPASDDSGEPKMLMAASSTGPGWRSQAVRIGVGAHELAERTARRKSVLGRALTSLAPGRRSIEVQLVDRNQWLLSCDETALAEGANLAMLGSELIQFGEAAAVGPGRFRLSRLLRGRGGTGWAIASHEPGDYFVLLERDALRPIAIPGWLGASRITAEIGATGQ